MDVFAQMPIIVIITGACVHALAKEGAFSTLAHLGICAFNTGILHLVYDVSTAVDA